MRNRRCRQVARACAYTLSVLVVLTMAGGQTVASTPARPAGPMAVPSGETTAPARDLAPVTDEVGWSVVQEMAGLNATLQQIQAVLDRLLIQQELDLLMKRIDLRSRRVAPMESELRGIKSSVRSTTEEIQHLELYREELEESAADRREQGLEETGSAEEREQRDIESRLSVVTERLESLQRRQIEVENELAEQREEIQFLEDALDDRLGLR